MNLNKNQTTRISFIVLILFMSCTIGYAAINQNTIWHDHGIVFPTVNATTGYWVGTTQIITNTRAATFTTLDTGQGANELYDMNQDVLTTSDVNFTSVEADEYFLNAVNITDSIPLKEASYIIETDGTIIRAINGTTGATDYSGTNQTALINQVCAISPNNGIVVLKAGQYVSTGSIVITTMGLTLSGEGYNTLLNSSLLGAAQETIIIDADFVTVRSLRIIDSSEDSIATSNNNNLKIYDNYIFNSGEEAIFLDTSDRSWVFNNYVSGYAEDVAGSPGIQLSARCDRNTVTNNLIKTGNGPGVGVQGSQNIVSQNKIYNGTGANWKGVELRQDAGEGTHYNLITNNQIWRGASYGVDVQANCEDNTISSNSIRSTTSGINVNADRTKLEGNIVFNSTSFDIWLNDGSELSIMNNLVYGGSSRSLQIDGTVTEVTIIGNKFMSKPVYIQGQYITFTGNTITLSTNKGLDLNGIDYSTITGNTIKDNNGQGIHLRGNGQYNLIDNNLIVETATTPTQNPGIQVDVGCLNNTIISNEILGHGTAITNNGSTKIKDNVGYTAAGDTRYNAGNLEMWNSTAWIVIGP